MTRATSWDDDSRARSVGTAASGVPAKIMRTAASLRHYAGPDSEELGWVHAHFDEWQLAGTA